MQGEQTFSGNGASSSSMGLLALQTAFLKQSKSRLPLCAPRIHPCCRHCPPATIWQSWTYALVREELSLADPRQGRGDFSMAKMITDMVVGMLSEFCNMARRAIGDVGEDKMLLLGGGRGASSVSEGMAGSQYECRRRDELPRRLRARRPGKRRRCIN